MQAQKVAAYVIIISFAIALLVIGKPFLVPLFLAIVLWYLINSINDLIRKLPFVNLHIPNWASLVVAGIIIIAVLFLFGNLIARNIDLMVKSAPSYRVNVEHQVQRILSLFGLEQRYDLTSLATEFNLNDYLRNLINGITGLAQRFFLILIYVIFLLVEQDTFPKKLAALSWSKERKENFKRILFQINQASRTYIAVKFGASLLTGVLSFIVLYFVKVDFPVFWAFLIFLLNFIPTIGSIVATAFPSLVALVQFDTLAPFFVVLIGIIAIQLLIGSFVEPRLLGNSLNISPFVIILSLVLWGLIWGVVGMLLCVPLTAILIVILAQFPNTRPVAILLSKNGKIGNVS
nr:transport protein [uncultured bacterium]